MERMSDERLAEIERELPPWRTQPRYAFAKELLQALKAEREYVNEREEGWREHVIDLHDKILTLEQEVERLREREAKLEALENAGYINVDDTPEEVCGSIDALHTTKEGLARDRLTRLLEGLEELKLSVASTWVWGSIDTLITEATGEGK